MADGKKATATETASKETFSKKGGGNQGGTPPPPQNSGK